MKTMGKMLDYLDKHKDELKKRHEETIAKKNVGSSPTIFLRTKIPKGLGFYNCGSGRHILDIIPFFVGNQNPNKNVKPGMIDYNIDIYLHRNVGVSNEVFVCPQWNWKKPCPVCEDYKNRDPETSTEEEIKKLKPKRNCVYLVWPHDSPKEENEGLKIWTISHFFFQMVIDELAELPRGGGTVDFSHPVHGKSIAFTRKGTAKGNTQFLGHTFVDRKEPIPEELLELAEQIRLDELIRMYPSYEEIYESHYGKPAPNTKQESGSQERKQEVQDEKLPIEEPTDDSQEEPIEESAYDGTCPFGFKMGVDTDKQPECAECPDWDPCAAMAEQAKDTKAQEQPKTQEPPKTEEKKQPLKRLPRK